ncbi:ATP-binding cassette, subfamily B [Paenibacillus algorifonticola]|uniref:ATP-binding cassette, subfamily B n=1 Tax=Paenibacillus algorifonticola TaxID=684063 RepID=A0A1I2GMX7_9BACL|nr:ABC transporter transmembrane domain-containing protein [Paenibacillus algorifonticola]SFF18935.1 ATP-binding cassette, subfamily B [Paenibacillus algorifonticola]
MDLQVMLKIVRRFAAYKLLGSVFLFTLLIEVAYTVAAPLSLKYLVDEAFTPRNFQAFMIILFILLGGGILNVIAGAVSDYSLGRLAGEVVRKLRTELFAHIQLQSLPFYERYRVGDLVTRFSADMGSIERVIRGSSPLLLKELLAVALGLIMLFTLEWKLTLAMLAGSVVMFVLPQLVQKRSERANREYKEAQERFSNMIDEMAKGHKTIRGLHQQGRFRMRGDNKITALFKTGMNLHMSNSLMERLPLTALLLLNGIMMGFGGYLIFHDAMTVGGFIAFFTLFMSVGQSGSNLAFLIPNLIESSISFQRIEEIMACEPDLPEAEQPVSLPETSLSLRMERVTFGYNEGTSQLKDISVEIEAGSFVAFVGPSGSGKSTALQLLSRFYDPQQGKVFIHDLPLQNISESSLRKRAALVSQDTFLFHMSLRENLLLGSDIEEADMIAAAKQAGIHEVIASWPEGYDTWIHHEGGSLSGGERQRIAIARALLRRPQLMLLDEVTSALDPAAEADINHLIEQLKGSRTIVSVTHRLSSVVNADRIYVFQGGHIVESGSHQQLLREQGLYSSLWEKQHGFYVSGDGRHAAVKGERLAKLPFFAGMEPALLAGVAELFTSETCREGESVVREGEEGDKFYIIVRGIFEIWKTFAGEADKKVAVLQDGDHFGEIALLRNIPRTATVKAAGPGVVLSMRREAFHQLTEEHPQLLHALEQTLQQRM